jgi:putative MATE family efflux protein
VATTHSALLALLLGIPFAVVGWFAAAPMFRLLGAAPDVAAIGADYLRIVLLSAPFRLTAIVLTRAYQGAGDSRTPLVVRGAGTLLNIALTIMLVPGLAGLPELGVRGAAVATAIGNTVSALVLLGAVGIGWNGLRVRAAALRDLRLAGRILRIAGPQILERNLYALGAFPLNAITLQLGTAVNAGLQVGQRVMLYGLLPSRGAATAASSIAGNALGSGDPDRADHVARGGLSLAWIIALPVLVATVAFAGPLAGIFVDEPEALAAATGWVRVYGVALVMRSLFGVLRGAFDAGGDTRPPLVASALGIGVGTVGLSWLLGVQLGLGVAGVFIGVLVDPLLRTAVLWRLFERGTWLRRLDDDADPAAPAEERVQERGPGSAPDEEDGDEVPSTGPEEDGASAGGPVSPERSAADS